MRYSEYSEYTKTSYNLKKNTQKKKKNLIKNWARDFPGGPVVKNLPSNAGDTGSIPGRGTKIPHAAGQLSPHAATTEPTCCGAHTPQLESPYATTRVPTCHSFGAHMLWSPCTTTREKPACLNGGSRVPQLRLDAAKNK